MSEGCSNVALPAAVVLKAAEDTLVAGVPTVNVSAEDMRSIRANMPE